MPKKSAAKEAVEMYLDALAIYLAANPDAGPSKVMADIPEIGNLRAEGGRAIRLYEQAVERSVRMRGLGEPFDLDLERVRGMVVQAQRMLD